MKDCADILRSVCAQLGLRKADANPYECGEYLVGNGIDVTGYFWFLPYERHIAISTCDFSFCRDVVANFPEKTRYIALRLEYAKHLPSGRIIAFLEESGGSVNAHMRRGMRVAYTEVMYLPSFYHQHLSECFSGYPEEPSKILRDMGGEHNWPASMMTVLNDIRKSQLSGTAKELYVVAKAYELMAVLLKMGSDRLPARSADFESVTSAVEYINENYTGSIEQRDLVRMANMSATKLKRLFKLVTGLTITQYVVERKTDLAMHLLADTDLPVADIARKSGFKTPSGFATSFKRQVGMTPREYRLSMRAGVLHNPSSIGSLTFDS